MTTVSFKFSIGDPVYIPAIDVHGVVTDMSYNGATQVFVKTSTKDISGWYPEIALEAAE